MTRRAEKPLQSVRLQWGKRSPKVQKARGKSENRELSSGLKIWHLGYSTARSLSANLHIWKPLNLVGGQSSSSEAKDLTLSSKD